MNSTLKVKLLICLGLAVVTLGVYGMDVGATLHDARPSARQYDFIYPYDDDVYVVNNAHIKSGLNGETVAWAFKSDGYASNWHPLTWISHALDFQMFKLNAMGHHWTNFLLHALSAILLLLLFSRMTQSVWKSAFVAALFALHPLHVESVAWVAERKDVLSTVFWMFTMLAYVYYVRRPGIARYALVAALFALGLLAKPMLVTLPVVLLLMDYWPLGRFVQSKPKQPASWRGLVVEKIPLFALAAGSAVMTCIAQKNGEAVATLDVFSPAVRVSNAIVTFAEYLLKMVWPAKLAVYYPHPGQVLPLQTMLSALFLAGVTYAAVRYRERFPYLLTGWLWYIVTLLPVIGLVQVGGQAMADRYTYIPLIGVFVAVAWLVPDLLMKQQAADPKSKRAVSTPQTQGYLAVPAVVVLIALTAATSVQAGYWKDGESLFTHCLAVTDADHNERAHVNLAVALSLKGKTDEAITHYAEAVRIQPRYVTARNNLGVAYLEKGRVDDAMEQFQESLRLDPNSSAAHTNLAICLDRKGRTADALSEFKQALKLNPGELRAHYELAQVLERLGDCPGAADHYGAALRLSPTNPIIANSLAWLRATSPDASCRNGAEAVELAEYASDSVGGKEPGILDTLAAAYAEAGRFEDAIRTEEAALASPGISSAPGLAKSATARLVLFRSHQPYRETREK